MHSSVRFCPATGATCYASIASWTSYLDFWALGRKGEESKREFGLLQ